MISLAGRSILILGGTADARKLASVLAEQDANVTLSLAGVTLSPRDQGVPTRIGGFGGAEGLAEYLRAKKIDLLIDATHPYAANISRNAAAAALKSQTPLLALRRPAWQPEAADLWHYAGNLEAALEAIGPDPKRLFVALGRKEIAPLATAPQHIYVIRSVDPVEPVLLPPKHKTILDRGPFTLVAERELLEQERIDAIMCKNSGGTAAYAKLLAARKLGLPVHMLTRPALPDVPAASNVEEALRMTSELVRPRKSKTPANRP
ncbi:cobalt-precorrin-6A reductase [Notoacmeibacter sp. MSK16QG-6]|uniref:cobalt-precorrin-6A reductase n=1 Tax=Notoacmeibacter sp. MSK16QG-6 TaxID=2957982 RepID=UPI00209D814F|nr:cobalt-precorrin-6A reductase [Notoacmeibacter sp. MSK16QG-6]MCP1199800.1 cobalt-precorrin-6A reductase [Notoacmeibacter sp. MSK16QG-6]